MRLPAISVTITTGIISSVDRGSTASMRSIRYTIGTSAVAISAAITIRRRSCMPA